MLVFKFCNYSASPNQLDNIDFDVIGMSDY